LLQSELAKDIYGEGTLIAGFNETVKASSILFGNSVTEDLMGLDEQTFQAVFEGVPKSIITRTELAIAQRY